MKKLDLNNYKKEDLILMNAEMEIVPNQPKPRYRDGNKIFSLELDFTEEEKLRFCDLQLNRIPSELILILEKYQLEKDAIKKGDWGYPKLNSLNAWFRKNDKTQIFREPWENRIYTNKINTDGAEWHIKDISTTCPTTSYNYDISWTGHPIINQIFHALLLDLRKEEIKYFKSIDEFELAYSKLRELAGSVTPFENERLNMLLWNGRKKIDEYNITLDDLNRWVNAYEELNKWCAEKSKEL